MDGWNYYFFSYSQLILVQCIFIQYVIYLWEYARHWVMLLSTILSMFQRTLHLREMLKCFSQWFWSFFRFLTVCQIMSKGVVAVLGPSASPASNSIISNICGEKEVSAGRFCSILNCAVARYVLRNNHSYHCQYCSHMLCSNAIQISSTWGKRYNWHV